MYDQRDIVLIPFPYSDLTGVKKRPALIISNNAINKSEDRICCLITSNPSKDGMLIEKKDFQQGKLPFKSWIKANRLFTISKKIIIKRLCKMDSKFNKKILEEINRCISLE